MNFLNLSITQDKKIIIQITNTLESNTMENRFTCYELIFLDRKSGDVI